LKFSFAVTFIALCGGLATLAGPGAFLSLVRAAVPKQEIHASEPPQVAPEDIPEEAPENELAPAALRLDMSSSPPLIQTLYQATRETKENEILARLAQARKLVESGADLKATDPQGRTALHWAVFGSSYSSRPGVLVAYEDLVHTLITRGVPINQEDVYQDTALDYL